MPKIFLLLLLILQAGGAAAQSEPAAYGRLLNRFKSHYNNGRYDSLFYLFSPEMKKALPQDATRRFFEGIRQEGGKMVAQAFEGMESVYAAYKATCERRVYSLFLAGDDKGQISGLYIQPYAERHLPVPDRNATALRLPFDGSWTVLWGGDTKAQNYHVEVPVQRHAFDFIVTDTAGRAYKTDSKTNEDYYAFGQKILAPCAAVVVMAVDGIPDNEPGQVNPLFVTGNTVVLKTERAEYLVLAHFKKHSVQVREGDRVQAGQLLGLCGNSGNSSEPHLHFHMQNIPDMNTATGIRLLFSGIEVNRQYKKEHLPVKGEVIRNGPR